MTGDPLRAAGLLEEDVAVDVIRTSRSTCVDEPQSVALSSQASSFSTRVLPVGADRLGSRNDR